MAKSDVATVDPAAVDVYVPGAEDWNSLVASADEVLGHELIKGEAADKLIGVPFIITRVEFRDGVLRQGAVTRDDYVSCEAVVAPKEVLAERARKGRMNLDDISVDPGEHIIFNDGSTGIYRQIVQYLSMKGLIRLPDDVPENGGKGASRYDLPRSGWISGADQDGNASFNVRMFCPRGLRYSEYESEFTPDGAKTRYIA